MVGDNNEGVGTETRSYKIGGIYITVSADRPLAESTFAAKIQKFSVAEVGGDVIVLNHHFDLPAFPDPPFGTAVYDRPPWKIYHSGSTWTYLSVAPGQGGPTCYQRADFNDPHTLAEVYHVRDTELNRGDLQSLTLFPTDQILLSRLLAYRQGCILHAAGLQIGGQGFAFVGHSEAGKTTISRLLMGEGQLLCDDRVILRRRPEGFRVYGTWSHGDIPIVSPNSAPLRAVFLLEQAPENRLIRLEPGEAVRALPQFVVRPLVTRDWWEKVLDTIGHLAREVPVYRLRFDKSGRICKALLELL
jgi:hypothetical protein